MTSPLETLIPELFWPLVDSLDDLDAVRLSLCSQSLEQRTHPILFNTPERLSRFMKWACVNGNSRMIRAAVSYGASVSIVEVQNHYFYSIKRKIWWTAGISTLCLTAKGGHLDAFKLLLGLGARLDDPAIYPRESQLACLTGRHLCSSPKNMHLLREYLRAELDSQVRTFESCRDFAWPLVLAIKGGAPLDLVTTMLDRGADPNRVAMWYKPSQCTKVSKIRLASPLSAAIAACSEPIVQLLLERGAEVERNDYRDACYGFVDARYPTPIPVLAAARAMATNQAWGLKMMQLCLDRGADINEGPSTVEIHFPKGPGLVTTTAMMNFLAAVPSWSGSSRSPSAALRYLVTRGASLKISPDSAYYFCHSLHCYGSHIRPYWRQSPVEWLIHKWGPGILAEPEFLEAIKVLGRHEHNSVACDGVADDAWSKWCDLMQIFGSCYQWIQAHQQDSVHVVTAAWGNVVSALFGNCGQDCLDQALWCLIMRLGQPRLHNRPGYQVPWLDLNIPVKDYLEALGCFNFTYIDDKSWVDESEHINALYLITMDCLIAAGANINARLGADKQTVFHKMDWACFFSPKRVITYDHESKIWRETMLSQRWLRLLSAMMKRGADPTLASSRQGQSPLARIEGLIPEIDLPEKKDFLEKVASIMRVAKPMSNIEHLGLNETAGR